MLETALLIEAGQADQVAWTGGRNPFADQQAAASTQPQPPTPPEPARGAADPQQPAAKNPQQQQQGTLEEPTAKRIRTEAAATGPSSPQEPSAYMVLRAQQLLTQLMPTLVRDQVPVAAEALNQLQTWTQGLWGHPIQLVRDAGTDSGDFAAATVPWSPPQPLPLGEQPEGMGLWRPARALVGRGHAGHRNRR